MKKVIGVVLCLAFFVASAFAATEVKMTKAEKNKLDTFFSNFSEQYMEGFSEGELTDQMMFQFAETHLIINASQKLKMTKDGSSVLIPKALIDKTTEKYFGKRIAAHESDDYVVEMASGEAYVFSQVDKLEQIDDGRLFATGSIYVTGSGETVDPHATPAVWKKGGVEVDVSGTFVGLIQKISKDGKDRYILLSYNPTNK